MDEDKHRVGSLLMKGVVMELHPEQQSENYKYFETPHFVPGDRTDGYYMTTGEWERMGRPKKITVQVAPTQ